MFSNKQAPRKKYVKPLRRMKKRIRFQEATFRLHRPALLKRTAIGGSADGL